MKLALREKQEELSEMILRKDLAEKRLATQQHEHEMNVEKLKRKLEEAQNQLKRKVPLSFLSRISGTLYCRYAFVEFIAPLS